MSTHNDAPQTTMAIAERHLTLGQVRAAIDAMMAQAQATSETPVCVAIVDASGNMEAFAKMDHARVFTRRHAVRKAYTSAIVGMNSGDWGLRMAGISQSVSTAPGGGTVEATGVVGLTGQSGSGTWGALAFIDPTAPTAVAQWELYR